MELAIGLPRTPKVAVRRFLRGEVGYACPICDDPMLTYHHIIPWSEEKHFRTEDMIALCYRHAREADSGAISRDDLRRLKNSRLSPTEGSIGHSFTVFEWRSFSLFFANRTVQFSNCFIVLRVMDENIIWFTPSPAGLLFSVSLKDSDGKPLLLIENNDWLVNVEDKWDCEVTSNSINVFSRDRKEYVKFRLNSQQMELDMDFAISPFGFHCGANKDGLQMGNFVYKNFYFKNMDIAFKVWKKDKDTWTCRIGERIQMPQILLHENTEYKDATVFLSGNAYKNCVFERCNLILSNVPFHCENCTFDTCVLHFNYSVVDKKGLDNLYAALDQLKGAVLGTGPDSK